MIILLANQPNQLLLLSRVCRLLRNADLEYKIVLVDYFTYVYGKSFINEIEKELECEIVTSEHLFRSWQKKSNPSTDNNLISKFFSRWNEKYGSERTLETILRTDAYTNNYERSLSCFKVLDVWKLQSHYDVLRWCEEVVLEFRPKIFVSIDMELLPTNIFFQMSQKLKIPFITFLDSRIMNRWVARKDLGYGMSDTLKDEIFSPYFDSQGNPDVENFISFFKMTNVGSYSSLSSQISSNANKFFSTKRRYLKSLLFELILYTKWLVKMLLNGPRSREFKVIRFDQSFKKLWISEFRRLIFPYWIRFDKRFLFTVAGNYDYFFWSLHDRPEGSGLVQGDGNDEVDVLIEFASLLRSLNSSVKILVKENALIYGLRKQKLYQKLIEQENIILINPYVNSRDYISNSLGVVGISGTVLLEAGILGKPSWALGHPEFAPALCGYGREGLEDFVSDCIDKSVDAISIGIKVRQYLNYIFKNSTVADSSLLRNSDPRLIAFNVYRMFTIITNEVESKNLG